MTAWLAMFLAAGLTAWQGHWQQNNQRSVPARNKSSSLRMDVELAGSELRVHMDANGGRKLDVTYKMGGPETVYTGTDGDEFHSQAKWSGDEIVFTVVEHEDGKLLPYTETWTLIDGGQSIQRVKISAGKKTTTVLERMPNS
jgi:hypothetical protein